MVFTERARSMTEGLIFLIVLAATFVHGLTGFGFGLVSVPLLQIVIGVRFTPPLVTLISAITIVVLALRYRYTFSLDAVVRLAAASTLIVPLGVYASQHLDEHLLKLMVGTSLMSYSSYALLGWELPHLRSRSWAYVFGSVSGLLSGLSNIGGPPLILYGNLCRWPPDVFKSNLQGVFLLNLVVVVLSHMLQGNFTAEIWVWFRIGVPAALLGLACGIWLSHRLDPLSFRKLILMMLLGLGLQLVVRGVGG